MTSSYKKYDVVVVKFPFASSAIYKARPAVIVSSDFYNTHSRNTVFVLAISSKVNTKLAFELDVNHWKESGLLKPSIFKASIATIEQETIITTLGTLRADDQKQLDSMMQRIL